MKKFLTIIMVTLALVLLAGCNPSESTDVSTPTTTETNVPVTLNTEYTDNLKLTKSFSGKEFIKDGIGEVRLERVVDGDTIRVYSGSSLITIRFLYVNTPESTGTVDAWGKAASAFAKEVLNDCYSIVLECDADNERLDTTRKRYLALVWYKKTVNDDYRLFNLEEVELAYSQYTYHENSDYHETFMAAESKTSVTKLRVWGEKDPDYNYSRETVEVTLLYLLAHHDNYQTGTKFVIDVRIVRTIGNNLYLEDAEEVSYETEDGDVIVGKGSVYAFYGYSIAYYKSYLIGDAFTITCQLEWEGDYGTQLTGLANPSNVLNNTAPVIQEVDANELNGGAGLADYYGYVIQLQNLTVSEIKDKTTASGDDYNIVICTNSDGDKFDIYFSKDLMTPHNVYETFTVGNTYNIIGGVAYYEYANGGYQLTVGDAPRYRRGVLNEEDVLRLNDIVDITIIN